ncbi:MAG: DEAD/DEAH box helicase family protein, partial [Thaumarchaeota archaeon]|nr:DEAD/DEAH box helicase family protein [Nitrososphaerota archaeon]
MHPRLVFDHGTIRIENARMLEIPDARYDERSGTLRAYGMSYPGVLRYLEESEIAHDDDVRQYEAMPALYAAMQLRDYQQDAVDSWQRAGMRGCVVLPTGSGKTAVGMHAICRAAVPALVLVPTIDLLHQWTEFLRGNLRVMGYERDRADGGDGDGDANVDASSGDGGAVAVGRLGGGYDDIRAVTVSTYDSAYARAAELGNRFGLLVFDEVHHLPAPGYRLVAEQCIAPFRLGLTATLEREDGLHSEIPRLAGGVVYTRGSGELAAKRHLAKYDVQRIRVRLTDAEQAEYAGCRSKFLAGLRGLGMRTESMYNLKRLILMSNRSKGARGALLARNRANEIAFNASEKTAELGRILAENCGRAPARGRGAPGARRKTIIFTQNNKMAHSISDRFLIPIITHKTAKAERRDVLDGFRDGRYVAVVTSRVLDEGVDVPDAELGVIVSGTGSGREMVQRLGRLLRPKRDGARARLIEIVSEETREVGSSARRTAALRRSAAGRPPGRPAPGAGRPRGGGAGGRARWRVICCAPARAGAG